MRVTFIQRERCFVFHDLNVEPEHKQIFRMLCNMLMHSEILRIFHARVIRVDEACMMVTHPVEGRRALHTGATVELTFDTPEGAMAFKLAYVEGDEFIPWRDQG